MTSALRRKRQTTAPNIQPKVHNLSRYGRPLVVATIASTVLLFANAWFTTAEAGGSWVAKGTRDSKVEQRSVKSADAEKRVAEKNRVAQKTKSAKQRIERASYSDSDSGRKLRWLPYRPSKSRGKVVIAAQHTGADKSNGNAQDDDSDVPTDRPRSSAPATTDAFKNPFGDRQPSVPERADAGSSVPSWQQDHDRTTPKSTDDAKRGLPRFQPGQSLPPISGRVDDKRIDNAPTKVDDKKQGSGGPSLDLPTSIHGGISEPKKLQPKPDPLDTSLARGPLVGEVGCISPKELTPIKQLTTDITAQRGEFPKECGIGKEPFAQRAWEPTCFTWKASGLCHKPLYFEDVQLERYGHSHGPILQPIISGGRFFVAFPVLPYLMGLNPPGECMYSLGYYRPGNCAPYMLDPLPISVRAALVEAAVVTGAIAIIP